MVPAAFNLCVQLVIMDYRKPSKKVIVETVLEVLKERGSVDTQTKMHKHTLKRLKSKDENYRLSAMRMRVIAIQSKKVKIGMRTRSVGAVPEVTATNSNNNITKFPQRLVAVTLSIFLLRVCLHQFS